MNKVQQEELTTKVKLLISTIFEMIVNSDSLQRNPSHLLGLSTPKQQNDLLVLLTYCVSGKKAISTNGYNQINGEDWQLKNMISRLGIDAEVAELLYVGLIDLKYEMYEGYTPKGVPTSYGISVPENIRQKLTRPGNVQPTQDAVKACVGEEVKRFIEFIRITMSEREQIQKDQALARKIQAVDRLEQEESTLRVNIGKEESEEFREITNLYLRGNKVNVSESVHRDRLYKERYENLTSMTRNRNTVGEAIKSQEEARAQAPASAGAQAPKMLLGKKAASSFALCVTAASLMALYITNSTPER